MDPALRARCLRLVEVSTREQGVPRHVEDPLTIERVVRIFRAGRREHVELEDGGDHRGVDEVG